jgi:hypothetical protein
MTLLYQPYQLHYFLLIDFCATCFILDDSFIKLQKSTDLVEVVEGCVLYALEIADEVQEDLIEDQGGLGKPIGHALFYDLDEVFYPDLCHLGLRHSGHLGRFSIQTHQNVKQIQKDVFYDDRAGLHSQDRGRLGQDLSKCMNARLLSFPMDRVQTKPVNLTKEFSPYFLCILELLVLSQ